MIFASTLKTLAVALALGTAATLVHAMVAPTSAQAGIGGAIKSAAKSVGGAAKTTVKSVGTAAKSLGTTVTHPSRIVSAAKAGAAGVKQVGGKVVQYVPGYKGASAAVKAAIDGKVKWR